MPILTDHIDVLFVNTKKSLCELSREPDKTNCIISKLKYEVTVFVANLQREQIATEDMECTKKMDVEVVMKKYTPNSYRKKLFGENRIRELAEFDASNTKMKVHVNPHTVSNQ